MLVYQRVRFMTSWWHFGDVLDPIWRPPQLWGSMRCYSLVVTSFQDKVHMISWDILKGSYQVLLICSWVNHVSHDIFSICIYIYNVCVCVTSIISKSTCLWHLPNENEPKDRTSPIAPGGLQTFFSGDITLKVSFRCRIILWNSEVHTI